MQIITKPRMWVYHVDCRDGRIVWEEEGEVLLSSGWVRNPNLLPKKSDSVDISPEKVAAVPRETMPSVELELEIESTGELRRRGRPPKVA